MSTQQKQSRSAPQSPRRQSFPLMSRRSITPTRITPVADTQLSTKNRCYICDVKLKAADRVNCKFCGQTICQVHCGKTRKMSDFPEPLAICDKCENKSRREGIKANYKLAAEEANQKFKKYKKQRKEIRDRIEWTEDEIDRAQVEQRKLEQRQNLIQQQLKNKIYDETQRYKSTNAIFEKLQTVWDANTQSEQTLRDKLEAKKKELEEINKKITQIDAEQQDLDPQVEAYENQMKSRIPLDQTIERICSPCQEAVARFFDPAGSILNGTSSGCIQPKQTLNMSIGSSLYRSEIEASDSYVRSQEIRRGDKKDCILM